MKYVLALLLTLGVVAGGTYTFKTFQAKNGKIYAYIINDTDEYITCWIGRHEFEIPPYETSLYYPYSRDWGCD